MCNLADSRSLFCFSLLRVSLPPASSNDNFRPSRNRDVHLGLRLQQLPRRHPQNDQFRLIRRLGRVYARRQNSYSGGFSTRSVRGALQIKKKRFEPPAFVLLSDVLCSHVLIFLFFWKYLSVKLGEATSKVQQIF